MNDDDMKYVFSLKVKGWMRVNATACNGQVAHVDRFEGEGKST